MVVAATGVQFEVVLGDVPFAAQAAHQGSQVDAFRHHLTKDGLNAMALTAKATFKQLQGQQAVAVAQARIDIAHQATFEHGSF